MKSKQIFPCDICGHEEPKEIEVIKLYNNNQPIHTCGNCGFIYVRERRTSEEIARSWSEEIFQQGYTAKIPYVLARQTYVANFIETSIGLKNKNICDIGAGEGQFLDICRQIEQHITIFGVEPSSYNLTLLEQSKINAFHGTIEQYRDSKLFNEQKFDIITIMWTLENCLDCNVMIESAYDMLNDGGHLVIATGSRILVPYKKPLHDYFSNNASDTHSFRFSANALHNIFAKHRFKNVQFNRYIDGDFLIGIGEKSVTDKTSILKKDDANVIIEFFNRWHSETEWFKTNELLMYSS